MSAPTYWKVIVVKMGEPIADGRVVEICDAFSVGEARKAYSGTAGVNVIVRPATVDDFIAYSNGAVISPGSDRRTVAEAARAADHRDFWSAK